MTSVENQTRFIREMLHVKLRPVITYPGSANLAWPSVCNVCGNLKNPTLKAVRDGYRCGHYTENGAKFSAKDAEDLMHTARFRPLGDYPGRTDKVRPSVCMDCGSLRMPRLANVLRGSVCKHRSAD